MKKAYRKLLAGLLGISMVCAQGVVGSVFAEGENFSDIYYYDFEDSKRPGIEGIANEIVTGFDSEKAVKITGDNYGEGEGIVGLYQYATIQANKDYKVGVKVKPINTSMNTLAETTHLVVLAGGMQYYWYPQTTDLGDGWYAIEFDVNRVAETETVTGDFYLRMGANNLEFVADDFYIAPSGLLSAGDDGNRSYHFTMEDNDACGLTNNTQITREFMYTPGHTGAAWKMTIPAGVSGPADLYGNMTYTTGADYKFSLKAKSLNPANDISSMAWVYLVMGSAADGQNDQYLDLTKTPIGDGWYLLESNVFSVTGAGAETTRNINVRIWDANRYPDWEFLIDDITVEPIGNEVLAYNYNFDNAGSGDNLYPNENSAQSVVMPGYGDTGYAWRVTTTENTIADLYIGELPLTRGLEYTYSAKVKLEAGSWDNSTVVLVAHGDINYAESQFTKEDLGNGWYKLSAQFAVPEGSSVAKGNLNLRFGQSSLTFVIDDVTIEANAGEAESGLLGEGLVGSTLTKELPAGQYYYFVMGSSDGEHWATLQNGTASDDVTYTIKASDAGKYIRFVIVSVDYSVETAELNAPVTSLTVALPGTWSANMTPIVTGAEGTEASYIVALAAYDDAGEMKTINLYTYSAQDGLVAQGTPTAISADATSARAFVFESFANLKPCCDYAELIR